MNRPINFQSRARKRERKKRAEQSKKEREKKRGGESELLREAGGGKKVYLPLRASPSAPPFPRALATRPAPSSTFSTTATATDRAGERQKASERAMGGRKGNPIHYH